MMRGFVPIEHVTGHQCGIVHATCGVELLPVLSAPFGEVVRVNVYAEDPDPGFLLRLAAGFGGSQPLFIGPMEFLAVLKKPAQPVEGLGAIPGHSGC